MSPSTLCLVINVPLPTKSSFFLTIAALALLCPGGQALPANDVKPPPLHEKDFGNRVGIDFSKTSEYKKETDKAIDDAYAACKKFLSDKEKGTAKGIPAVVSDLDETLIDNRPHFEKTPEFNWPAFEPGSRKQMRRSCQRPRRFSSGLAKTASPSSLSLDAEKDCGLTPSII